MDQQTLLTAAVAATVGFIVWFLVQPPTIGWPAFVISGAAAPFIYEWFRGS